MPADQPPLPGVAGVVLAAGRAQRFGADKRWASWQGEPLLAHVLRTARAACERVLVVVERLDPALDELLERLPAEPVICPEAHRGLAFSRRCGLDALKDDSALRGVLVFLGDMPAIRPVDARRLGAAMLETGLPVRPVYRGDPGHPVACPARWLAELGESGFPAAAGRSIEWEHAGVVRDVDRPVDLDILPAP
ncbi:nucleotidyltransferase family protein [Guyparkeria sp. SCN-R1]|uniref:nucleotidyltransferase family protein n=1 Tax=Guyparkeria sp. SCN-R1 TaxID=2341113 RepID=UPI000F64C121|nr:nucleotidyltransferase family protein [Guyparkeria sp. SCN-R1]RRQ24558.1 nucleotidyltransferase family protein [Guyparkeria sp. SCN-R1]